MVTTVTVEVSAAALYVRAFADCFPELPEDSLFPAVLTLTEHVK